MSDEPPGGESHLSRIETLWSVVRRAHGGEPEAAQEAQRKLLELYGGAVRRYLIASLRDPHLADELFQEFALKFVSGGFRNADPAHGRFRAYVKTTLFRMMAQHFRASSSRKERALPSHVAENIRTPSDDDEQFLISWRDQILDRTWAAFSDHERRTGVRYNAVLRLRIAEPAASSEELAARIGELLGKSMTPGSARVLIHRAREKFAELLVDAVSDSLEDPSKEELEAELIDLRLMVYCHQAFEARK